MPIQKKISLSPIADPACGICKKIDKKTKVIRNLCIRINNLRLTEDKV